MKLSLSDFERRNFLILTFAGIINAIGVTIFLAPVKLYDTGRIIKYDKKSEKIESISLDSI